MPIRKTQQLILEILKEMENPDLLVEFASEIENPFATLQDYDLAIDALNYALKIVRDYGRPLGIVKYNWSEEIIAFFNHDPRYALIKDWELRFPMTKHEKLKIAVGGFFYHRMNRHTLWVRLLKTLNVRPKFNEKMEKFDEKIEELIEDGHYQEADIMINHLFSLLEKKSFKERIKRPSEIHALKRAVSNTFGELSLSDSLKYLLRYQKSCRNFPFPILFSFKIAEKIFENFSDPRVKKIYSQFKNTMSLVDRDELKVDLAGMFFRSGRYEIGLYFLNDLEYNSAVSNVVCLVIIAQRGGHKIEDMIGPVRRFLKGRDRALRIGTFSQ
ncbi:MAG: hypothetical protein OHK0056_32850 [Bacteriovoracaceae bacterium]